jgi:hypothetical protein
MKRSTISLHFMVAFTFNFIVVCILGSCSNSPNPQDGQEVRKIAGRDGQTAQETKVISQDKQVIQSWFNGQAKPQDSAADNDAELLEMWQYQALLWQWDGSIDENTPLSDEQLVDLCAGKLFKYKTQDGPKFTFKRSLRAVENPDTPQDIFNKDKMRANDPTLALVGCSLKGHPETVRVILGFGQEGNSPQYTRKNFRGRLVFDLLKADQFNPKEQEIVRNLATLGAPSNPLPPDGEGYRYYNDDANGVEKSNAEDAAAGFHKHEALLELNGLPIDYEDAPAEAQQ